MVLFPALGIKGSSDRVFALWCTAVWSFIYASLMLMDNRFCLERREQIDIKGTIALTFRFFRMDLFILFFYHIKDNDFLANLLSHCIC